MKRTCIISRPLRPHPRGYPHSSRSNARQKLNQTPTTLQRNKRYLNPLRLITCCHTIHDEGSGERRTRMLRGRDSSKRTSLGLTSTNAGACRSSNISQCYRIRRNFLPLLLLPPSFQDVRIARLSHWCLLSK